jgi:hypothetical protein
VHRFRRACAKGMSTRLLREQNLLRDIEEEHRTDFPADR